MVGHAAHAYNTQRNLQCKPPCSVSKTKLPAPLLGYRSNRASIGRLAALLAPQGLTSGFTRSSEHCQLDWPQKHRFASFVSWSCGASTVHSQVRGRISLPESRGDYDLRYVAPYRMQAAMDQILTKRLKWQNVMKNVPTPTVRTIAHDCRREEVSRPVRSSST